MITINKNDLKAVSLAMSKDETKPQTQGVFLEIRGSELRLVATDGFRMHIVRRACEPGPHASVIIPDYIVKEALKLKRNTIPISYLPEPKIYQIIENIAWTDKNHRFPDYRLALRKTEPEEGEYLVASAFVQDVKKAFECLGEYIPIMRPYRQTGQLLYQSPCKTILCVVMCARMDRATVIPVDDCWGER
jgi:hypothetical protein